MTRKYRILGCAVLLILLICSYLHAEKRRRLMGYVDVSSSAVTLIKGSNPFRKEIIFLNSSEDYQVAFSSSALAITDSFPYGAFPLQTESYLNDLDSTYDWYAIAESTTVRVYWWESW